MFPSSKKYVNLKDTINILYGDALQQLEREGLDREAHLFFISKKTLKGWVREQIKAQLGVSRQNSAIKTASKNITEVFYNNLVKEMKEAASSNSSFSIEYFDTAAGVNSDIYSQYPLEKDTVGVHIEYFPNSTLDTTIFEKLSERIVRRAKAATFGASKAATRNAEGNTEKQAQLPGADPDVQKELDRLNTKLFPEDFEIGHLYNSNIQTFALNRETELLEDWMINELNRPNLADAFRKEVTYQLDKSLTGVKKSYHKARVDIAVDKTSPQMTGLNFRSLGSVTVFATIQGTGLNKGDIKTAETRGTKQARKNIEDWLFENFDKIKGSPTIPEDIAQGLLYSTTKRLKKGAKDRTPVKAKPPRGRTSSAKGTPRKGGKKTRTTKIANPVVTAKPANTVKKVQGVQDVTSNLVSLKTLINEHLPDYIQKNMGKGASKEILNYRTGRFANSAELRSLAQVKGSKSFVLDGLVTYMRNPYDVFRPGGKLHKPGRDPKKIINKSIRQILKEKALIALSFRSEVG
jgi:transcriptional regulator